MKNVSVEYFDNSIEQLDKLLAVGNNMYFEARQTLLSPDKTPEDKQAAYIDYTDKYHLWAMEVRNLLRLTTDRQYYEVNFMTLSSSSYSIVGLSQDQANFITGFSGKIKSLLEILTMLEERRSVVIRQEIAKQEHDQEVKYELRYSSSHELTLNGILLANPDFLSENEQLLAFLFTEGNAWRPIKMAELLEYMKEDKLKKKMHQILDDLNITGSIREAFFKGISINGFEFRNPITYGYAEEHKLPIINLSKPVRSSKK